MRDAGIPPPATDAGEEPIERTYKIAFAAIVVALVALGIILD